MMKKTILIMMILVSVFFAGCSNGLARKVSKEVNDKLQEAVSKDNKYVLFVKDGHPTDYPSTTYGKAFEGFFGSPSWRYFKAEDGRDVVEFTGDCMYQEVKVKAKLQFILNVNAGTFETGALSFNDVPQTNLITASILTKVFQESAGNANNKQNSASDANKPQAITKTQAVELTKAFMRKQGTYMPSKIEVDSEDNQSYTVHAYDIVDNHTATTGWYIVNKSTGKVESMF